MIKIEINGKKVQTEVKVEQDFVNECVAIVHTVANALSEVLGTEHEIGRASCRERV